MQDGEQTLGAISFPQKSKTPKSSNPDIAEDPVSNDILAVSVRTSCLMPAFVRPAAFAELLRFPRYLHPHHNHDGRLLVLVRKLAIAYSTA